jgi:hypothetical protein
VKLPQKIFGIGLVTAVIVPHLFDKGYSYTDAENYWNLTLPLPKGQGFLIQRLTLKCCVMKGNTQTF